MKIKSALVLAVVATSCLVARAQSTNATAAASVPCGSEIMPLIVINEAPLEDAIKNLARQACLNIQIDPNAPMVKIDPKTQATTPISVSFHWENVNPMQALQALLDVHGLQLVQDNKTRIAKVAAKEPNALEPLIPRVISLKYSNPTNMLPFIKATIGSRGQVIPDIRTGQMLVLATEKEMASVDELIARLDTAPSQILIEAQFIETLKNPRTAKGVDWTRTLSQHSLSFGNRTVASEEVDPLTVPALPYEVPYSAGRSNFFSSGVLQPGASQIIMSTAGGFNGLGVLNSSGLNAVISFLNSDNQTETLSTPRAVALEGVQTELSDVRNIPIFEEQQGQATVSGISPVSIKPRYDVAVDNTLLSAVGVRLIVTPHIYGVTNVFLDLKPEISAREGVETTVIREEVSTAPVFSRKRIQTQAMVPSGNTLVLGGLTRDFNEKVKTKVPFLGDVPLLGRAFRSDGKSQEKRQLLIFVTPTILGGEDYLPAEESREFLQQKPVEKPEVPWGPWDSATPKDWTQPVE